MQSPKPKNAGGNPNLLHDATGYTTLADLERVVSRDVTPPSLSDLGINRMASHRWQTMADGATLEATAAAAGVDPKTVQRWTVDDPALANAKAVGKDGKSYPGDIPAAPLKREVLGVAPTPQTRVQGILMRRF